MNHWPVDPTNPGEVLACAGLAHLAWRRDPAARTGFTVRAGGEVRFEVPAPPRELPLERLGAEGRRGALGCFLVHAGLTSVSPREGARS